MTSLISVIVPVYNVEEYLQMCLDSILNQTYKNLEILLIDDGSTDKSGEICNEYALKDTRFTVIHQANKGLSGARNTGLDKCKGDYIVFVDSDDVLPEDSVQTLLDLVTENHAQIGQGTFTDLGYKGEIKDDKLMLFSGKDILTSTAFSSSACAKIYAKDIWLHERFREGIIHEDDDIMYRMLYETERVAYRSKCVYFVRERRGSITRSGFSEKKLALVEIDERIVQYFQEKPETELLEVAYTRQYCNLLQLYSECKRPELKKKYRENFKYFIRIKRIGVKTKIKLIACYFFPALWGWKDSCWNLWNSLFKVRSAE